MTIIAWIRLGLIAWEAISARTRSTADEKIAAELHAALNEYEKTAGTEVTKVQLESLRTTPQW